MMTVKRQAAALILLAATSAARAGTFSDVAQQLDNADPAHRQPAQDAVRIQVAHQLQIPTVKAGSIEDQVQSIASYHALLYRLAAHECDHIVTAMPGDCRIVTMTVGSTNVQFTQPSAGSLITATVTFEHQPRPPQTAEPAGVPPP